MNKRIVVFLACALMAFAGHDVLAQSRFGVMGGINFSTSNIKDINKGTMTQWHAGVTYKLDLPLGFSLQPSLLYNVKGAKVGAADTRFDLSMGYLELPVSVQWGPDLLLFRPFLDVTPYIGYALNNKVTGDMDFRNDWKNVTLNRLEYGLGLGIGLEIWRFQVIGRYNWNFGSLYDAKAMYDNIQDAPDTSVKIKEAFSGNNFGGITLSVAFMFGK